MVYYLVWCLVFFSGVLHWFCVLSGVLFGDVFGVLFGVVYYLVHCLVSGARFGAAASQQ